MAVMPAMPVTTTRFMLDSGKPVSEHTTVDGDHLPRDVSGRVRQQECNQRRDFLGLADAAGRHHLQLFVERHFFDHVGPIGRASCREGEFQYVSISVFATSLKKKKKK